MALALIGTMTGPLLVVLGFMPRALFAGVFLAVGWGSIQDNGITHKVVFLLRDHRFIDPQEPLHKVSTRQIAHYVFWQLVGVLSSVAICQTSAAVGFPVIILALVPFRWGVLPKIFSNTELSVMDELTATGDVVLASLGGKPLLPGEEKRSADGARALDSEESIVGRDDVDDELRLRSKRRKKESDKEWVEMREGLTR